MPELSTDLLPTSPIPSGNNFPQTSGATGPVPQASPQSYFEDSDPAGNRTPQSLQDLVDSYDSQKQPNQPNDIQDSISNKELKDNSRYGIYRQGADNEDIAAQNQSGWNRAGNAGWQFVNKIGAYLTQTAGFIGGAIGAAVGGATNIIDKWAGGDGKVVNGGNAVSLMTDNFMTQLGDVWKDAVQNSNPIYKTDKYTNGSIWQKLGTTSWWLDDFVDRAALTGAMLAPGMLEAKGLGLFGTIVKAGDSIEGTGLVSKAFQTMAQNPDVYGALGKVLGNAVSKSAVDGTVDLVGDAAMNFKNMMKGAQNIELTSFNVIGQNALNGREAQTDIRNSLKAQREQGLNSLSDSDIENKAAQGAVDSFWYNMPLTALSSLYELPQVFSSMKGGLNLLEKVKGINSIDDLVEGLKSLAAKTVKPTLLKTLGKSVVTGIEHGQLESSQVAIGRYIDNAIAGKVVNGKVEKDEDNPLLGSFKEYINNFSDPNGQNNIALGTIQGLLTTIFGRAYKSYKGDYKAEDQRNRDFAARIDESIGQRRIFNAITDTIDKNPDGTVKTTDGKVNFDQTKLTELGASYVDHIKNYYDRLDALQNNDKTAIEQMNFESLRNLAQDFFQDAKGKEYLQNVLRFEQTTQDKDPNRTNDVTNGVEETPSSLLTENLNHVENLYKAYNAIDQRHGGLTNFPVNVKNKDEVNAYNFFIKNLKSSQYNEAANQIFYNNKLLKNNTELLSLGGDPNTKIEAPSSPSEERINDIIDENERLNKNLNTSKEAYKFLIDKKQTGQIWDAEKKKAQAIKENATPVKDDEMNYDDETAGEGEGTETPPQPADAKSVLSNYLSSVKDTNPALGDVADEYNSFLTSPDNKDIPSSVDNVGKDIDSHISNLQDQIKNTDDEDTKTGIGQDVAKLQEMKQKVNEFHDNIQAEDKFTPEKKSAIKTFQDGIARGSNYATPDLVKEEFPREAALKDLYQNINSTIEPPKDSNLRLPYMDRHQSFLSNFSTLPNRAEIRAIKVTKSNESSWGLAGLTSLVNNGYLPDDKITDATEGIVTIVYVSKDKKGDVVFVDKNGKVIKDDLLNNAVYSTMGNAKTTTYGNYNKVRNNEDPEQVKLAFEAYKNDRENVFKIATKQDTKIHNFHISDGQAVVEKGATNPVVGSLVKKEQLNQKNLLKISTTGEISNENGQVRKVPLGTPAIITPSGIYFLNNRLFTSNEAKNITNVLKKLAGEFHETGNMNPAIIRYLQGQFQWVAPGPASKVANNQMYIDDFSQQLVVGTDKNGEPDYLSYFHPDNIEKNRDKIESILQTKYNNVNNKFLTTEFEQPYNELFVNDKADESALNALEEKKQKELDKAKERHDARLAETVKEGEEPTEENITKFEKAYHKSISATITKYAKLRDALNPEGLTSKEWKSYQEYLLSSEGGKTPPLTTRVRTQEKDNVVSNDYNISRYSTLEDLEVPQIQEKKPAIVSKVKPTVNKEQSAIEAKKADIERKKEELRLFKTPNQIIQKSRQELYDKWLPIAMEDTKLSEKELIEKIDKEGIIKKAQKEYNEGNHLSNLQQFAIYLNTTRHSIEEVRQEKEQYNKIVAELATLEENPNKTFELSQGENISYTTDDKGNINITEDAEYKKAFDRIRSLDNGNMIKALREENKANGLPTDDKSIIEDLIKTKIQQEVPVIKAEDVAKPVAVVQNVSLDEIRKNVKPGIKFKPKSQYKTISSLDVPRMTPSDHAKFTQWMKVNLPKVPSERIDIVIRKTGGGYAWGVFENGMIKIFSNAERGTEYHEAFEAVWNSFLSDDEQNDLINDYKLKNKGTSNLSDSDIKEKMADDFGDYILSSTPTTFSAKVRKFFNDLISFFKGLINKPGAVDSLFKRINTGYYSAAEVYGNPQAAYHSIKDLSQEIISESIDHITASMMRDLAQDTSNFFPENLKSIQLTDLYSTAKERLFDGIDGIINGKFDKLEKTPEGEKAAVEQEIKNLYTTKLNIDKRWNKIIYEQIDYLRAFNVNVDDSDEQANVNDDNRGSVDFNIDTFKVDSKTSAPSAIKLLFATITNNIASQDIVEGNVLQLPDESTSPSIGGMQTAPFGKSFIQVMEALTGENDIHDQIDKLVDLAKKEPNYVKLFTRLKGSLTTGKIDFSKLEANDWRLLTNFYNAFSKQKPVAFLQYVGQNGTYVQAADLNNVIANTVSSWMPSIRNNVNKKDSLITYNDHTSSFSINRKAIVNITNPYQQIALLRRLGIPFTTDQYNEIKEKDLTDPKPYSRLRQFSDAISSIKSTLSTLPDTNKLSQKWLNIAKPLTILSRLTNSLEVPEESSVLFDGNNEMIQKYVLHNYLSVFANDFNNVKTLPELLNIKRYLNDAFSANSLVLKKGGLFFDEEGSRTSRKLEVGTILSSLDTSKNVNTELSKLLLPDRLMLEYNMNMKGWSYNLSTSDSGREWMINLGNNIPETSFFLPDVWKNVSSIFNGYLKDEINLIKEKRGGLLYTEKNGNRLRLMGNILRPPTVSAIEAAIKSNKIKAYLDNNAKKIDDEIKNYFIKKADAIINDLTNNNKILTSVTGTSFDVPGLDNSHKTRMNETELKSLFQFLTVNNTISAFELHKIYYGDPFQFKIKIDSETGKPSLDETKRIKSAGSSKELPFNTPEYDNFANVHYNKSGNVNLAKDDIGYTTFKPYANTVTVKDVIVRGSLAEENAKYAKVNEADSSGWQSFPFYRQMERKRGTFSDEAEAFFQRDMAAARRYFDASPEYDYEYSSEDLRSIDDTLLSEKPIDYKVSVTKPLAYGPEYDKDYNNLIFDKDSEIPLTFELAKFAGKNMLDMFYKLHNDKASDGNARDYFIVESGRKVGIPDDTDDLYNKDGSVNMEPFKTDNKVDLKNKGTQVESAYKEKKQTMGKQPRVLALQDIFDRGKPLSEDIGKLATNYTNTLNNLTKYGYKNILNLFGIKDLGDKFQINDYAPIAETFRQELLKQAVSDNVKQAVRLDDNGQFPVAFEATNVYDKIRGVVNSIVNKNLISQKVNGSGKTQVTSTLFERNNRQAMYKKDGKWEKVENYDKLSPEEQKTVILTSNELRFYTTDKNVNGKIIKVYHMEVYLPRWFANKSGMSDEDLIKYLNSSEEGQKVLRGIGFRIPTQRKNSIEAFIVKGFLPQSMGNSVVVPSEITMKAGSDFDYDKLNTYLKNVEFDKDGLPHLAKLHDIKDTNDEDQLRDYYTEHLLEKYREYNKRKSEVSAEVAAAKLFKDIFADEDTLNERSPVEEVANMYTPSMDEFVNSAKGKDIRSINEDYNPNYKAVLENEFFQATEDLMLHPDLYERLITPNEGGGDFPDLRDKVMKALGSDSGLAYPSIIDTSYRAAMRHNAVTASDGRGIIASNITLYTKLQAVNSYLDPTVLSSLSKGDKIFIPNLNILLSHNTIDVNGKKLPTFSGMLDVMKNYISDNLSNLMDGMVDITKDPWITELFGTNSNVHSTVIFMTMLGMKPKSIAYFVNQPIVREYLKSLSSNGKTYILDKDTRDRVKIRFSSAFATPSKINEENLLSNIEKYYKDKNSLNNNEKAEQHLILDEFLKYVSLSSQLYGVNSALSYDTKLKGNASFDTRKMSTDKQKTVNLISGIDDVLNNSFLGPLADNLASTHDALSEIFPLMKPDIRNMFNSIRSSIDVKFMKSSVKETIANGIQKSFIDYLLNTQTKYFTQDINKLLINPETSVATQLREAKDSGLNNNFVNALSEIADRKGLHNVKLDKTDTDVFTSNSYISSFRQLKQQDNSLYNNLIKLAIIQSGTQMSKLAYSHLIPLEDYQLIAGDVISKLDIIPNVKDFQINNAFFRNNWNNNTIVPTAKGEAIFNRVPASIQALSSLTGSKFIQAHPDFGNKASYPVLKTVTYTRDKNGKSIPQVTLYQKVMQDVQNQIPFITDSKQFIYKQVNGWGDGIYLQEYYNNVRPSQYTESNLVRIDNEIVDKDIVDAYTKGMDKMQSTTTNVEDNSVPLKENNVNKINIYAGTNENKILSNLANRPFILNGGEFNSVEQFFQESKLAFTDKKELDYNTKIHKQISESDNQFDIKRLGRQYKGLDVSKWNSANSNIMKMAIKASFEQNQEAMKALINTGDAQLTHTQDKGKWGTEFPKLLMEVRSELLNIKEQYGPDDLPKLDDENKNNC